MKMITDAMLLRMVEEFKRSWRARIWYFVTDELRNAILDSVIFDLVRCADAADAQRPITPAELIDIRDRFTVRLARGVRGAGYMTEAAIEEKREERTRSNATKGQ